MASSVCGAPLAPVLIYGDSMATGLSLIAPFSVHAESQPGATSLDMLRNEKDGVGVSMAIKEDAYHDVVLMVGTNDGDSRYCLNESIRNVVRLVEVVRQHSVVQRVHIATIINDDWNKALAKWIQLQTTLPTQAAHGKIHLWHFMHEEINTDFLEDDGVHLKARGQQAASIHLQQHISTTSLPPQTD